MAHMGVSVFEAPVLFCVLEQLLGASNFEPIMASASLQFALYELGDSACMGLGSFPRNTGSPCFFHHEDGRWPVPIAFPHARPHGICVRIVPVQSGVGCHR